MAVVDSPIGLPLGFDEKPKPGTDQEPTQEPERNGNTNAPRGGQGPVAIQFSGDLA